MQTLQVDMPKRSDSRKNGSSPEDNFGTRKSSKVGSVALILICALIAGGAIWYQQSITSVDALRSFTIVAVSGLAAAIRIDAAPQSSVTAGLGAVSLSLFFTTSEEAAGIYGMWLIGSAIGSSWYLANLRNSASTMFVAAFGGAALVATRLFVPSLGDEIPFVNAHGQSVEIALSVIAYFLMSGLVVVIIGVATTGVSPLVLWSSLGWSRLLMFAISQAVLAAFAYGFTAYISGTIEFDIRARFFETAVAVVLGIVAISEGFFFLLRMRQMHRREQFLTATLMSMPWPVTPSVKEQIVEYLQKGLPGFTISAVSVSNKRTMPHCDGRTMVSRVVEEGNESFVFVVKRSSLRRPFTSSDKSYLDSVTALGAESLRADNEISRLRSISSADPMTGMLNYRGFRSHLIDVGNTGEDALSALVFMNIQNLTQINEEYSPEAGDTVLRTVARRIGVVTEDWPQATSARIAGDEFGVLLVGLTSERQAERMAWEVDSAIAAPVITDEGLIGLTVSQTIVFAGADTGVDFSELIARADEQMYRARRKYVNMAVNLDREPERIAQDDFGTFDRATLGPTGALIEAIKHDRLRQVYEPIIDCATKRIVALEAAVRYTDPIVGRLPTPFIRSESDRLGLRTKMCSQIMEHAVKDMVGFQAVAPDLKSLHINITVAQLIDREFTFTYERLRAEHPEIKIVLELEGHSIRLAPQETAEKAAVYIESRDVPLVIDDTGTSFSEISAMINYPFTALKLDESLIGSMQPDRANKALHVYLNAVKEFQAQLIINGVSSSNEASLIERMNVEYAQGPFYGRPVAANEFRIRLETMGLDLIKRI